MLYSPEQHELQDFRKKICSFQSQMAFILLLRTHTAERWCRLKGRPQVLVYMGSEIKRAFAMSGYLLNEERMRPDPRWEM